MIFLNKKTNTNIYYDLFFLWQTEKETCFGPIRSLFSFSAAQTEKNSCKKLGKTRFVVWWFDPMSSLNKDKMNFDFLPFFVNHIIFKLPWQLLRLNAAGRPTVVQNRKNAPKITLENSWNRLVILKLSTVWQILNLRRMPWPETEIMWIYWNLLVKTCEIAVGYFRRIFVIWNNCAAPVWLGL